MKRSKRARERSQPSDRQDSTEGFIGRSHHASAFNKLSYFAPALIDYFRTVVSLTRIKTIESVKDYPKRISLKSTRYSEQVQLHIDRIPDLVQPTHQAS